MNDIFYLTGQETSGDLLTLRRRIVRQRRQRQAAVLDTQPSVSHERIDTAQTRYLVPDFPNIA